MCARACLRKRNRASLSLIARYIYIYSDALLRAHSSSVVVRKTMSRIPVFLFATSSTSSSTRRGRNRKRSKSQIRAVFCTVVVLFLSALVLSTTDERNKAFALEEEEVSRGNGEDDDYLDLLAELDASFASNGEEYPTSEIQLQIGHEITVRGASSGNEKLVQRDIDFIVGDDYASAAFRFCVKHELFHHQHVRSVALKIKEEIEKMPEEERPTIGSSSGRRRRREGVPERRKKTAQERYDAVREYLNETKIVKAGEELSRLVEEFQDHQLNSDEHIEQDKEDLAVGGPLNRLVEVMKRAKRFIKDEEKQRDENEKLAKLGEQLRKKMEKKRETIVQSEEGFKELLRETYELPKKERLERIGRLPPVAKMDVKIDGKKKEMLVFQDQDAQTAVFEWCVYNGIREPEKMVDVLRNLLKYTVEEQWRSINERNAQRYVDPYYGKKAASVEEAVKMWEDGTDKLGIISGSKLLELGAQLKEKIAETGEVLLEKEYEKTMKLLDRSVQYFIASVDFETAMKKDQCKKAMLFSQTMIKIDRKRPVTALQKLFAAKCKLKLKKFDESATDAFSILSRIKTTGDWKATDIKYLTVYIGGMSAIKLGDFERALKFYAICVRNDPDFGLCKDIYKNLNSIKKSMKTVDDKLNDKHPRPALEALDAVEVAAKSLGFHGVKSFENDMNVRKCRAAVFKRQLNDAYDYCQSASDYFGVKAKVIEGDPLAEGEDGMEALLTEKVTAEDMLKYAEALRATAELYIADENPKEAKSLAEQALEICRANAGQSSSSRSLKENLESLVRETHNLVRQYQHNRDYAKILGVPPNLNELPKERQCDFIKKSFKKLALKWHPDKHETNARKTRAARKLNDAAEARDELNDRANCGGAGSVNRERARAEKAKEEERNRQNWARGGGGGGYHHWGGHQHHYQRQWHHAGGGGHWEF